LHAAAWRSLQLIKGEAVVYNVHSTVSISIELAVLTQPKTGRIDITDSVGFESRRWNWLIDPNDLVLPNRTVIIPAHGHSITRGDGSKYIVTPDNNDLCWRWSDASQVWRRVFCQEQ
jgi:hypothetical protein